MEDVVKMPRMCCVPGCKSNYRSQSGPTITTFAFPKEVHLNKKWVRCIHRDNFTPGCAAVVCIKHFSEGCLIREDVATRDDGTKLIVQRERPKLKKDAIPSIFSNHPCYFANETLKQCKDPEERAAQVLREDETFESYSPLHNEEFAMKCRQMCQVHYEEPDNHEDLHSSPPGSTDQAGRSIDLVSCAAIKEEPVSSTPILKSLHIACMEAEEQEWSSSPDEADPLQDGVEDGQNDTWPEQGNAPESSNNADLPRYMKSQKAFGCSVCQKVFKFHSQLLVHNRTHTEEKPYECELCKKHFTQLSSLNAHRKIHTGEKPYQCNICKKQFNKTSNLNAHSKTHISKVTYQCEICGREFNKLSNLNAHSNTHLMKKPYECETCKKQFNRSSTLSKHCRTHTGEKPYQCDICNKQFSQLQHLTTHNRVHTGEKPYQCGVCKKEFAQLSHLTRHGATHTGEKPHHCDVCKKQFTQWSSLAAHRVVHTGEKPYQCEVCEKHFTQLASLNTHRRIHTGEKPYQCKVCNKRFNQSSTLNVHSTTHTQRDPIHKEQLKTL